MHGPKYMIQTACYIRPSGPRTLLIGPRIMRVGQCVTMVRPHLRLAEHATENWIMSRSGRSISCGLVFRAARLYGRKATTAIGKQKPYDLTSSRYGRTTQHTVLPVHIQLAHRATYILVGPCVDVVGQRELSDHARA